MVSLCFLSVYEHEMLRRWKTNTLESPSNSILFMRAVYGHVSSTVPVRNRFSFIPCNSITQKTMIRGLLGVQEQSFNHAATSDDWMNHIKTQKHEQSLHIISHEYKKATFDQHSIEMTLSLKYASLSRLSEIPNMVFYVCFMKIALCSICPTHDLVFSSLGVFLYSSSFPLIVKKASCQGIPYPCDKRVNLFLYYNTKPLQTHRTQHGSHCQLKMKHTIFFICVDIVHGKNVKYC